MTAQEVIKKVRAEIERHKELFKEACDVGSFYACARRDEANAILEFLSDLEKSNSKDFPTTVEEMKQFLATHPKVEVPEKYKTPDWMFDKSGKPIVPNELKKEIERQLAIFPYTKVTPELPESRFIIIRKELFQFARHFAQWQKEQMMKEAVEGVVCYGSKGAYVESDFLGTYDTEVYGKPGDKVRVIVLPKED